MHGTAQSRTLCGRPVKVQACGQARLDLDGGHRLEYVSNSCGRMVCETCAPKAVRRAAKRATERLDGVRGVLAMRKPRHFALSPPQVGPESWTHRFRSAETADDWKDVEQRFRRKCRALLGRAGLRGGAMVVHVYRCTMKKGGRERYHKGDLYLSPHVHVVAWGRMQNSKQFYEQSRGWVYANLDARLRRERQSIEDTLDYVLHHAAWSTNVVTYWGCASTYYVVLDGADVDVERELCDVCDEPVDEYALREDGTPDWQSKIGWVWRKDRRRRYRLKRPPPWRRHYHRRHRKLE